MLTKFACLGMAAAAGMLWLALTPPAALTAAAPTAGTVIPVVACPSSYGGDVPTGPTLPHSMRTILALPGAEASKLAYYTNDKRTLPAVMGPRGWTCRAAVGADGTAGIDIYPPGTTPKPAGTGHPGLEASSDSQCQGCVYSTVCPFVPGAGKELGYTMLSCPPLKHGEVVTWLAGSPSDTKAPVHDVISFREPGADPTNGVVLYDFSKQYNGMASEDDCTLAASEQALCTAALNDFIHSNWLMP